MFHLAQVSQPFAKSYFDQEFQLPFSPPFFPFNQKPKFFNNQIECMYI